MKIKYKPKADGRNVIYILSSLTEKLRTKFSARRESKFIRDGLDLPEALDFSQVVLTRLISREVPPDPIDIKRNEILAGVDIPPYDPINLDSHKRDLPPGLSDLCKRGPSFVPVPTSFDWLQLQKDFEQFWNSMRAAVFFSRKESDD